MGLIIVAGRFFDSDLYPRSHPSKILAFDGRHYQPHLGFACLQLAVYTMMKITFYFLTRFFKPSEQSNGDSTKLISQNSVQDCGAACLAMVAYFHGMYIGLNRARKAVRTTENGTTLAGMKKGAESLGFIAKAGQATPEIIDHLNQLELPAILLERGNHWFVLFKVSNGKCTIGDPSSGHIEKISKAELKERWLDRSALLLRPGPHFNPEDSDKKKDLFHFLKASLKYRNILLYTLAFSIVLGLVSLISPLLMQILTDDVLRDGNLKLLNTLTVVAGIIFLLSGILQHIQSTLIAHFVQRLELDFIRDFCWRVLRLPLKEYEGKRSGEIASRLQDLQEVNQIISQVVISLPSQLFVALLSLSFMFFYSVKLTLLALLDCCALCCLNCWYSAISH